MRGTLIRATIYRTEGSKGFDIVADGMGSRSPTRCRMDYDLDDETENGLKGGDEVFSLKLIGTRKAWSMRTMNS